MSKQVNGSETTMEDFDCERDDVTIPNLRSQIEAIVRDADTTLSVINTLAMLCQSSPTSKSPDPEYYNKALDDLVDEIVNQWVEWFDEAEAKENGAAGEIA